MTVVIHEIVSEVVLSSGQAPDEASGSNLSDEDVIETIVRLVSARVLRELRLEWER